MRTKNVMILGVAILILIAILVYAGTIMIQADNNTTTNNSTVNITLNNTNNTTDNSTTSTTQKTTTKSSNKSNSPRVVDEEIKYNYQVDDGSYYREVSYSDGSFKQYDLNGKEISTGELI